MRLDELLMRVFASARWPSRYLRIRDATGLLGAMQSGAHQGPGRGAGVVVGVVIVV